MIPRRESYIATSPYRRSYHVAKKMMILFTRFLNNLNPIRTSKLNKDVSSPLLFLKNYGSGGDQSCTSCGYCSSICPVDCLTVTTKKGSEIPCEPETFLFDISQCVMCWLCVDVCPEDAIGFKESSADLNFERLKKIDLTTDDI